MKHLIKKILSEGDFDWAKGTTGLPDYIRITDPIHKTTSMWVITIDFMYGDADGSGKEEVDINGNDIDTLTMWVNFLEQVKFYNNKFRRWGIETSYEGGEIVEFAKEMYSSEFGDVIDDLIPFNEYLGSPCIEGYEIRYFDDGGVERRVEVDSDLLKRIGSEG